MIVASIHEPGVEHPRLKLKRKKKNPQSHFQARPRISRRDAHILKKQFQS